MLRRRLSRAADGNLRSQAKPVLFPRWQSTSKQLVFVVGLAGVVALLLFLLLKKPYSGVSEPSGFFAGRDAVSMAMSVRHRDGGGGLGVRSCDKILALTPLRGNGFGAQLNWVLETASLALLYNASIFMPKEEYWNYGCGKFTGWECYFQELQEFCGFQGDRRLYRVRPVLLATHKVLPTGACSAQTPFPSDVHPFCSQCAPRDRWRMF